MADEFLPRDHAEKVALHRAQVIGGLVSQLLFRGDLKAELRRLSEQRFVPPVLGTRGEAQPDVRGCDPGALVLPAEEGGSGGAEARAAQRCGARARADR